MTKKEIGAQIARWVLEGQDFSTIITELEESAVQELNQMVEGKNHA